MEFLSVGCHLLKFIAWLYEQNTTRAFSCLEWQNLTLFYLLSTSPATFFGFPLFSPPCSQSLHVFFHSFHLAIRIYPIWNNKILFFRQNPLEYYRNWLNGTEMWKKSRVTVVSNTTIRTREKLSIFARRIKQNESPRKYAAQQNNIIKRTVYTLGKVWVIDNNLLLWPGSRQWSIQWWEWIW